MKKGLGTMRRIVQNAGDGARGIEIPKEALLAHTLVALADNLVADFDVVELLTLLADRCVEVLDVAAAGLMLSSPDGELRVVASSSEEARVLELFEVQSDEGPCVDCFRTGQPIVDLHLDEVDGRWPHFGPKARAAGFQSVHAFPLRLRNQTIGALNLYRLDHGRMPDADVVAAQALTDVATIAILQHRAVRDAQLLNEQLSQALNTRIVIEQAKGVVAERAGVDMEEAFARLRRHARRRNLRLVDVAEAVSSKAIAATSLDP
jgi:GAF domain-containing protein